MEDACHSEGVEEEEKWGDIGACRHQPENRKVLTLALHRRHRPCRRLLKMPSAKGSRKDWRYFSDVCVCVCGVNSENRRKRRNLGRLERAGFGWDGKVLGREGSREGDDMSDGDGKSQGNGRTVAG